MGALTESVAALFFSESRAQAELVADDRPVVAMMRRHESIGFGQINRAHG